MHTYLIDMLACPACHGELEWTITRRGNDRIEEAEARCKSCSHSYPVHEGIGIFLTDELQRNDLWEQVDSGLMKYLKSQPELYQQLMSAPLESLSPADRSFRGMLLEELGDLAEAHQAYELATPGLYTPEYLNCSQKQSDYVIDQLASGEGPIVDLASGVCYLVEKMASRLHRPIVATDFSPRVLRKNRKRFEFEGLYDRISLLAFDARRAPFKDGAIETLTTYLGLPNIENPGTLLKELRRIVNGSFLAISHFFPEEDQSNREEIQKLKLETSMYRRAALESFSSANWRVRTENLCTGRALPTPPSVLIDGLGIDALPVSETELEWCTLLAR